MTPPVDAAEFDAHKDLAEIIIQFLCRNKDKGYSSKEISQNTGLNENDINHTMVKIGLRDLMNDISSAMVRKKRLARIEDVTINGIVYYRCVEK